MRYAFQIQAKFNWETAIYPPMNIVLDSPKTPIAPPPVTEAEITPLASSTAPQQSQPAPPPTTCQIDQNDPVKPIFERPQNADEDPEDDP